MRGIQLIPVALSLLPFALSATVTEPPTKTITEIHTVTYIPKETPTDKNSPIITQTLYETVGIPNDKDNYVTPSSDDKETKETQQNQAAPILNATKNYDANSDEDKNNEAALLGYDADYFQSRLESDQDPEIEDQVKFQELNQDNDDEDDDGEDYDYDESYDYDGENNNDDDDNEGEGSIDAASPYHLQPGYRGNENPKELEKPRPADQSSAINEPNPSFDQNKPVENNLLESPNSDLNEAKPNIGDEESKYIHSNFTAPEKNEQGHPIPQPIGDHDPEDGVDFVEEEEEVPSSEDQDGITKGKQILDSEESTSLLIGNSTNTKGDSASNLNNFQQGQIPSFLGRTDKGANDTEISRSSAAKKGKSLRSMLSRFDNSAASLNMDANSYFTVLFIGGVTALLAFW
ncbi:Midasin [Wickerhamomyces ciferrii]|uniref:Midasin n=1 Tax=Wickerhamomyces ciferrii (strain ATCC 14091 / BCRC 22168 / CBS 111 / JCM 3599 / NBRC 0793 / NRRL Y-1031 F-60-10) TaxID=1206466 RepID=K0KZ46_WICCF|nr:Midasin [Wickerhamomyces ciferrii]CCH46378.1 Midasin [Wickerhamomyces ciferrii]